jgi:hypothetical protein
MLHASVSRCSTDELKPSEIFFEQNNAPNRRAGRNLALFQQIFNNLNTGYIVLFIPLSILGTPGVRVQSG